MMEWTNALHCNNEKKFLYSSVYVSSMIVSLASIKMLQDSFGPFYTRFLNAQYDFCS